MDRRNWLKKLGTGIIAGTTGSYKAFASNNKSEVKQPERVHRIAHLTDIHLSDAKGAPEGFAKCLHHLQNMEDKPDLIMNGGDTIDDALLHTKKQVKNQWDTFHKIMQDECCLSIEHCIGNHDVWGLPTEKKDSLYGKKFALEQMELENTYRSFDKNGWHFIILDSTHERSSGLWYMAKLGNNQLQWLADDLAKTPSSRPVMIVSHIPILSAAVFFDNARSRNGKISMPATLMHSDYKKIIDIFSQHTNIKLCVSGHLHLYDHVEYNGISYFCNGAVSGDWWNATEYKGTKAGYALIDLYDDGSFTNQYINYNG